MGDGLIVAIKEYFYRIQTAIDTADIIRSAAAQKIGQPDGNTDEGWAVLDGMGQVAQSSIDSDVRITGCGGNSDKSYEEYNPYFDKDLLCNLSVMQNLTWEDIAEKTLNKYLQQEPTRHELWLSRDQKEKLKGEIVGLLKAANPGKEKPFSDEGYMIWRSTACKDGALSFVTSMTQPARINLPKEAILGKITEYQNSLLGIKIAELLPKQVRAGETVILTIKGENLAQCPQVKVVDPKTKQEIKDVEIALLPCSDNSKQMQFAVQAGAAAAGKKVWLIVISGPGQVVSKDSAPVYPTVELEIIPGGAGACASIAGKIFLIETNQNLQCSVIPAEITIGQETIISVSRMDDRPFTLPVIDPPTDIEVKNMKIEDNTVVLTLLAKDGATTGDRNIGIYDSLATADSITFDYGAFQVTVKAKPVEVKPKEAKPKEVKPGEVKPRGVKPAEEKPAGKDDGGDFDL